MSTESQEIERRLTWLDPEVVGWPLARANADRLWALVDGTATAVDGDPESHGSGCRAR